MRSGNRIYDQVRRNLVAIEVLRNVGELHQVVLHRHWDDDERDEGNPRTGWAPVLAIHDLAMILEALRDELHTLLNDLD
ncbi:MAG: hypothetical protein KC572_14125 [Gammaproteobacteria bacterium]|nr:hypothetical protein [Gammaproteobacteria bacterium]